jgi:uncharacterized protein YkwD
VPARAATAVLLTLAALVAAPAPASALSARPCPGAPSPAASAAGRHAVLCLLNAARTARGLPRLRPSAPLSRAATRHARAMARQGFFDHVSPGGSTPRARATRAGYTPALIVGETLAWGTGEHGTALGTVSRWLTSPDHERVLLDRRLRDAGIGAAPGSPFGEDPDAATVVATLGRR